MFVRIAFLNTHNMLGVFIYILGDNMTIYDKINNLIKHLDQEEAITNIKSIQNEIKNNKNLINKIISKENVQNIEQIRQYRHLENKINYMILELNQNLKKIERGNKIENNSR